MTKKRRRLREKRKAEIRSKQLKRVGQRLNAKYGKPKLRYPIPSMLILDAVPLILRRFGTIETSLVATMNEYNELQERIRASLEGS